MKQNDMMSYNYIKFQLCQIPLFSKRKLYMFSEWTTNFLYYNENVTCIKVQYKTTKFHTTAQWQEKKTLTNI